MGAPKGGSIVDTKGSSYFTPPPPASLIIGSSNTTRGWGCGSGGRGFSSLSPYSRNAGLLLFLLGWYGVLDIDCISHRISLCIFPYTVVLCWNDIILFGGGGGRRVSSFSS